jgi:uncharacterized membrane protein
MLKTMQHQYHASFLRIKKLLLENKYMILICFLFAAIYSLISIVNHYLYRTSALDLGIYTHGVYQYAHFKPHTYTLGLEGIEINHLGNHFSPIIALFSPLIYLFGSYTLLIVQIAFIIGGGVAIYRFTLDILNEKTKAYILLIHFYVFFGIFSALAFDFHANVLGAMLVPWFLYLNYKKSNWQYLFFALILLSKENIALWMIFICIGLLVQNITPKQYNEWKKSAAMLLVSIAYFAIVQFILMPALNPYEVSNHLSNYAALGDSFSEILGNILGEPRKTFALLFESFNPNIKNHGIKSEFIFMFLVSGGIVFFYKPVYAIMILPLLAQKMFSSQPGHWGINAHYSIEFIAIISVALIFWIKDFKPIKSMIVTLALLLLSISFNIASLNHRTSRYYNAVNSDIFKSKHYKTNLNIKELKEILKTIPKEASVSSSTNLAPRLALRDKIYHFPHVKDADYIVVLKSVGTYPLSLEKYKEVLDKLIQSPEYRIANETEDILVLKKFYEHEN